MSAAPARVPRSAWAAAGAAAAAGGAWIGVPGLAILAAGLATLALGLAGRQQTRGPWLVPAASGAGAILLGLRVLFGPASPPAAPLPGGSGPWTALVTSTGSPRDGAQVARLALDVVPGPVIVAATLPSFPTFRAGAIVEVEGRLRPPPDDDPYGEYLRRTGAAGSLLARRATVVREPEAVSLQALRDAAGDTLRTALPEPEAGLAAGILIGLRERVDRALAADFATAGASHVVAISGWNIAIVAGLVGALLRGRVRRRTVAIAVGATITAYVVAAGGSPSVVRAAVMAGVVLGARESGRAGRAPAALALAALVLLLADPAMIGDAGFRLSVMATAGLLAWATPLGTRLQTLGGGRMPSWLAESLGISLAAQAATLPDVLLTFGRLSLVSPAVNLLVVPLVPAAMACGVIAMLGGALVMLGAPAALATVIGLPAWLILHVVVAIVRGAAGLPFAAVAVPPEVAPVAAALAAAAVLGFPHAWRRRGLLRRHGGGRSRKIGRGPTTTKEPGRSTGSPGTPQPVGRRAQRLLLAAGVVVITISTLALGDAAGRGTRLVMLDVGQGDAILLESGNGARILVDGGPDPDRLLLELDAKVPPWDRRIDVVVLTHPHEDHVAGLVRVLERYRVGRALEPGMRGPGPGWEAWDAALRARPSVRRGTLAAGAQLHLGEISLRVLWPPTGTVPSAPGATGRAINDTSIVLLGEALGRRFLLTGDAEEDVDPALVAQGLPRVDVLKVAHHGSATATSAELLVAVKPAVALVSVGAGNDYGHPAPSTLARLRGAGAHVYRTDLAGAVEVELRRDGLSVRTSGPRRAALRAAPDPGTGYDPFHDRPGAPRGRQPAALPRTAPVVPRARLRRGRRGRLARQPASRPGHRGGRPRCRDRSPPARRGQAAGGGTPGWRAARRRLGRLARGPRHARARDHRPRPPGDTTWRRDGCGPSCGCAHRGARGRLRGQARGPAAAVDGRALRLLAAPLPGGVRVVEGRRAARRQEARREEARRQGQAARRRQEAPRALDRRRAHADPGPGA